MSLSIDLKIKNPGRYAFNRERLFGVADVSLRQNIEYRISNIEEKIYVSLLIANKHQMAKYNLKYHQTEGPTDVLSFPYMDSGSQVTSEKFSLPPGTGTILGDIIICFPVARETGLTEGKTTQEMIEFYFDHGLQHLLGNHHD